MVATAPINQRVDLEELGKLKEIIHDQDKYGGRVAYFKSPNTKGTVCIFASGKMISVGTTSEVEAVQKLELTKEFLVKKGFVDATELKTEIQNIVVTANLGKTIDLEEIAVKRKIRYEPEQFPGGILRIKEPYKATVLLFASGKAVITGLKGSSQISAILQRIADIVGDR